MDKNKKDWRWPNWKDPIQQTPIKLMFIDCCEIADAMEVVNSQ